MKKVIYLQNEDWSKSEFEFENIEELLTELESRKIVIGNRVKIGNRAVIGNRVKIGNDTVIGNRVKIGNDTVIVRTIFIVGSKHCVTFTGNSTLSIGCLNYSIEKWIENFEVVGAKEGYSKEEIKEYKLYIDVVKIFSDNLNTNI